MDAEGWYGDPYGAHERRWFSAGTPTSLVWDRGSTSRDDGTGSYFSTMKYAQALWLPRLLESKPGM
jgi:hypothetical protein